LPDTLFDRPLRGAPWMHALIRESTVIAVIALNALVIFLDAFPPIHSAAHSWLQAVDYACILYFVAEMAVKLYAYGARGYFASSWNVFDFSIVVLSSPALLIPFGLTEGGWAALLVLRLVRLSRFLRLLRFIPRLERLIAGAKRALKASVGVLLAMVFYVFIFGLAGTYLFGGADSPVREKFADPLISMFTMFTVFTVEGWFETPETLAGKAGYWAAHGIRLFFVVAVIFGGIILLSLLNAVFVEEMSSDLREQAEDEADEVNAKLDAILERLERIESDGRRVGQSESSQPSTIA
jgi:voltage-gated sodium channel